jgi:hypothetical protein
VILGADSGGWALRASIASRARGNFVRREVVDDDDVIALERWHETLFDIREVVFQCP